MFDKPVPPRSMCESSMIEMAIHLNRVGKRGQQCSQSCRWQHAGIPGNVEVVS